MNYSIYLLGALVPSRGHMMNRGCLRKGHVRKTGWRRPTTFWVERAYTRQQHKRLLTLIMPIRGSLRASFTALLTGDCAPLRRITQMEGAAL